MVAADEGSSALPGRRARQSHAPTFGRPAAARSTRVVGPTSARLSWGSSALPGVDGEIGLRPWGPGAIIGLYTLNKKHTLLGTVLSCMNYATLGPVLSLILITVVALIETAPLLGAHRRTRVRQRIRRLVLRCTSSVNEARRETRHWHEAEEGVRVEKAGYSFCVGILLSSG